MPSYLYLSFAFYAFINGITPGPANLCSLSASLRFGKEQALKQWRGLFTGFFIDAMVSVVLCYFLGTVLGDYVKYLSIFGALYLLRLAFHMLKSSIKETDDDPNTSCSFKTGLFVNLTNVKVILYCVTSLSIYVLPYTNSFMALLAVGVILPFTGPICNLVWLFLGDLLKQFFVKWQKQVNIVMALSLAVCAVTLVL